MMSMLLVPPVIIGRHRARQWEVATHWMVLLMIVGSKTVKVPTMDRGGHLGLLVGQIMIHVPHVGETASVMTMRL